MRFSEECGIFGGISYKSDIAPIIQKGLFMLQHRGQENAGLCCGDNILQTIKGKGLVMEVLTDQLVKNIKGRSGIGHVRYSTQGTSDNLHAQPYMIDYLGKQVAIAHNGNCLKAVEMRTRFEKDGEIFLTTSDTEMILKKVTQDLRTLPTEWKLEDVGRILNENFSGGAWSILFGFPGRIMGFRDPYGYRPLMLCESKEGVFLASEDSAFHLLNNKKITEIEPGQAVEITPEGYKIQRFANICESKKCVFEQIYFAKPDSNIFGRNVYTTRVELGKKCAIEHKIDADVVVPIMDSGFPAAIGYSYEAGIPLHMGLARNNWVGRTFIQPEPELRKFKIKEKLAPIISVIADKKIVLVDDSLVRGNTSREIVKLLKDNGAKEVHYRIASPRIINTCHWGVNIPSKEELITNSCTSTIEIAKHIKADSVEFLSFTGLKEIFGEQGWCYHCFER